MASIVKMLRVLHNDKQQDLADLIGVSVTNYNLKENDKSKFTLEEAKLISDKYKVSIDKLISSSTKDEVIKLLQK